MNSKHPPNESLATLEATLTESPIAAVSLEQHLDRIDVFKIGLRNSFEIDFRTATKKSATSDRKRERFHFLGEILPLIRPRAKRLAPNLYQAYLSLEQKAEESFWKVYEDFQPMVHHISESAGVLVDDADLVLGRTILLFEVSRRKKFVTYLEKSLRESIKNLRGRRYAQELGIPVSAGRLVPQLLWKLDQTSMQLGRSLSKEESEIEIITFLCKHRAKFSGQTMERIAAAIHSFRANVSIDDPNRLLDALNHGPQPRYEAGNDCHVEQCEEREFQLAEIMRTIDRAGFDAAETVLVLNRLGLPHDHNLYQRTAASVTEASLRKRKQRLLVRLMAAKFAPQSPTFGVLLVSSACKSRPHIRAALAKRFGSPPNTLTPETNGVDELLNWMSLSDAVYRISILDRERLRQYLLADEVVSLPTPAFQKLVAALIDQERLNFPCLQSSTDF